MRLMKLMVMAGIAYLGYRFYQDIQDHLGESHLGPSEDLEQAMDQESGRMQTLTGGGRGTSQSIGDMGGGMREVQVGRGVH